MFKYKVSPYLSWLFPYKDKKIPLPTDHKFLYYVFQNKISLTFINWLFQGMLGMGYADLTGKIALEVILLTLSLVALGDLSIYNISIALILSHTVNWLINSHFWDFGRYLGITRTPPERFFPYIHRVVRRINKNRSIYIAIIIGSISRKRELKETSDVDMIFIRGKGLKNAINAVLVTMRERAIAFFYKFPLHLDLYDTIEMTTKHREDETPVVLKDTGDAAKAWYRKAGREMINLGDYERKRS